MSNCLHQTRRNLRTLWLCLCLFPGLAFAAGTDGNMTYVNGVKTITLPDETAVFTSGPDVVLVTETCTSCHSSDYPTTQPRLTRDGWLSVVEKMQHHFAMEPLTVTDETLVLDYLTTYYGQ